MPHSLPLVAIGGGIVWLGWNGFNGGDPYFASADAATAVINTNMATVAALLTWVILDMYLSKAKKPTFLGAINGMVVGLVAITPCAGYVNGAGALGVGAIDSTHRLAGLELPVPGQLHEEGRRRHGHRLHPRHRRPLRRPAARASSPTRQWSSTRASAAAKISLNGAIYGHPGQIGIQLGAALTVIIWDGLVTFVILTVMKAIMPSHSLKYPDEILEIGDLAIHDEEGYPDDRGATRVLPGYSEAAVHSGSRGDRCRRWCVMILVTAVIKPHALDAVREALSHVGIAGMTISEVQGFGRQRGHTEVYRGAEYKVEYVPKVKIEILTTAEMADDVVEAISKSARTGKIGDGEDLDHHGGQRDPDPHR